MSWKINSYTVERTVKIHGWVVENEEEGKRVEILQTSGSVSVVDYKGCPPPPNRNYYTSGLMNAPVAIMDQWLNKLGVPSFNMVKKRATPIEAPEKYTKKPERHFHVHYIKRQLEALQEHIKELREGTVFCCAKTTEEGKKEYYLQLFPELFPRHESEPDEREFPEPEENERWLEAQKNIGSNTEILNELSFCMEHEKDTMMYDAKMWLRRQLRV